MASKLLGIQALFRIIELSITVDSLSYWEPVLMMIVILCTPSEISTFLCRVNHPGSICDLYCLIPVCKIPLFPPKLISLSNWEASLELYLWMLRSQLSRKNWRNKIPVCSVCFILVVQKRCIWISSIQKSVANGLVFPGIIQPFRNLHVTNYVHWEIAIIVIYRNDLLQVQTKKFATAKLALSHSFYSLVLTVLKQGQSLNPLLWNGSYPHLSHWRMPVHPLIGISNC